MIRTSCKLALFLAAPLIMSCQSVSIPQVPPGIPVPVVSPVGPFTPTGNVAFDIWRDDFALRAHKAGFSVARVRSVLADAKPVAHFFETADVVTDQAEFSKPIWDYVAATVSASRVETGKKKLAQDAALFDALERTYGVSGRYLAAFWGVETSYGAVQGDFDAPSVLASMAVEGRRRSFAEDELLAIMRILDRGDAERSWLKAGWAGAMGHTQFMPSTFYSYAVDWTGDGTKDVWRARADGLASAANYLKASGWNAGQPALREVRLPDGFNYGLADGYKRPVQSWQNLGVTPMTATSLAPSDIDMAELWLPAGSTGPAFLLFPNFDKIMIYNRSGAYALSVAILAESFNGGQIPLASWPKDIDRLSIEEIKLLQAALNKVGYDAGVVDGIAGKGTRRALQKFQSDRGMMADGFPTKRALVAVISAAG